MACYSVTSSATNEIKSLNMLSYIAMYRCIAADMCVTL